MANIFINLYQVKKYKQNNKQNYTVESYKNFTEIGEKTQQT